ncbi:MAG TPA: SDR family NAD(P)-dependent oxidoreductase [Chitinophagaceae bacterium]
MNKEYYTLITGASEGFGKALSLECARRGMHLILVALPGDELFALGRYIHTEFGVKTICLPHDLTKREECQRLHEEIVQHGFAINMLINNAGIGGTHFFKEKEADYYQRQIALNVTAPTLLTHLLLENLQQNNPSHILNVSSLASFFYLPAKQVYGATKSYLVSFSKSLGCELKQKNISVSAICPGGMNTTLAQVIQNRSLKGISRWSVMDPEDVAKVAIDNMLHKKQLIVPGFWNRLFLLMNRILPQFLKDGLIQLQTKRQRAFKPIVFAGIASVWAKGGPSTGPNIA